MAKGTVTAAKHLDVARIRKDFPILRQTVHGKPLVYLDNAATSQKPQAVIDSISRYYSEYNANIHRGVHALSEKATEQYEDARRRLAAFLGAPDPRGVIFLRGTTEAINLVANTFVQSRVQAGDEIIISHLEHHSNIVPWQLLCQRTGAKLKVVPIDDDGALQMDAYEALFNDRTAFVSIAHVSNALGTVNPIERIVKIAHDNDVPVLVDGAQAVPHMPVDVARIGADFYTVSAHKMYGPTGVGALYGRLEHLEAMPPWQGGGDMIRSVAFEKTEYNELPFKFEAGTPDIAGAIGLGAAVDYLQGLGMEAVHAHETELLAYAHDRLIEVDGVRIIGNAPERAGLISFTLEGVHPHDIGTLLDREGIAVRTGHHCAQPVMQRFGVAATARASFGVYNTPQEIDALAAALDKIREVFA